MIVNADKGEQMIEVKWRYETIGTSTGKLQQNEYVHYDVCFNCREEIIIYIKKGNTVSIVMPKVKCQNCGVFQGATE